MRSIILRGPVNSFRLIKHEKRLEKQFNIQTSEFIKSNSSEYFHYQGASYFVLFRLFRELTIKPEGFRFLDIGSGKGRVLFMAEYFGFNNLIGIELNPDLVRDAQINQKTYALKRKDSQIDFIFMNALEFEYRNETAVYFLFNPFNAYVLKKILEKIKSVTTSETWFIYMNPLYSSIFQEMGIPQVKVIKSGFYTEAVMYKIEPSN